MDTKTPTLFERPISKLNPGINVFIPACRLHEKPEVFEEISREINEILDNGKIDPHEIPQIVLLISKIYQKNTPTKINLINIVRYTVEFILDMEMMEYYADFATMKNIIDSSIDLLKMNLGPNENCFSLFRTFC